MGDPVAIVTVLAGCAGYLIGYWRGRKSATAELSSTLTPWIASIQAASRDHAPILICGHPYVAAQWADEPSKERMH